MFQSRTKMSAFACRICLPIHWPSLWEETTVVSKLFPLLCSYYHIGRSSFRQARSSIEKTTERTVDGHSEPSRKLHWQLFAYRGRDAIILVRRREASHSTAQLFPFFGHGHSRKASYTGTTEGTANLCFCYYASR